MLNPEMELIVSELKAGTNCWFYAVVPAVAGVATIFFLNGIAPAAVAAASIVLASATVSGVLLSRRHTAVLNAALTRYADEYQKKYAADVASFFAGLSTIESEITSIRIRNTYVMFARARRAAQKAVIRRPAIQSFSIRRHRCGGVDFDVNAPHRGGCV